MMNLFKKLDRMAERLIATMDDELQEPVVRAVTGEVFAHGTGMKRSTTLPVAPQLRTGDAQHAVHQLYDSVAETLNPPLSLPAMPNASISTQVT